jgi:hypothetical protein
MTSLALATQALYHLSCAINPTLYISESRNLSSDQASMKTESSLCNCLYLMIGRIFHRLAPGSPAQTLFLLNDPHHPALGAVCNRNPFILLSDPGPAIHVSIPCGKLWNSKEEFLEAIHTPEQIAIASLCTEVTTFHKEYPIKPKVKVSKMQLPLSQMPELPKPLNKLNTQGRMIVERAGWKKKQYS